MALCLLKQECRIAIFHGHRIIVFETRVIYNQQSNYQRQNKLRKSKYVGEVAAKTKAHSHRFIVTLAWLLESNFVADTCRPDGLHNDPYPWSFPRQMWVGFQQFVVQLLNSGYTQGVKWRTALFFFGYLNLTPDLISTEARQW